MKVWNEQQKELQRLVNSYANAHARVGHAERLLEHWPQPSWWARLRPGAELQHAEDRARIGFVLEQAEKDRAEATTALQDWAGRQTAKVSQAQWATQQAEHENTRLRARVEHLKNGGGDPGD